MNTYLQLLCIYSQPSIFYKYHHTLFLYFVVIWHYQGVQLESYLPNTRIWGNFGVKYWVFNGRTHGDGLLGLEASLEFFRNKIPLKRAKNPWFCFQNLKYFRPRRTYFSTLLALYLHYADFQTHLSRLYYKFKELWGSKRHVSRREIENCISGIRKRGGGLSPWDITV